uniref:Uncharacterized protein n=1 Tax=Hyaloperonospora arabidopsidis (strain Emoy2) TaxID=559515 RepID=M4B721_HYAAE
MAELAANVVMDSRASQQTCATDNCSLVVDLQRYLRNDVQQWQACPEAHNPGRVSQCQLRVFLWVRG